jgi:hypothetical protein
MMRAFVLSRMAFRTACRDCMEAFWVTVQVFTIHTSALSQFLAADQSEVISSWAIASDSAWLTLQPNVVIENFGILRIKFCRKNGLYFQVFDENLIF